jgi:hypothetical protein
MRREMVIDVHLNHDPKEARDLRHLATVRVGSSPMVIDLIR